MSRRSLALGVFLAAWVLATGTRASAQVRPAAGPGARATIILTLPFENTSELTALDWLGEGLAELTIERLGGPGLYLLPRQDRLDALERIGLPVSTRFSRASMLVVGQQTDADHVIFGHYDGDGRAFSVTARILRLSPPGLSAEFVQSGPLADWMGIHARLAWRLLCAIAPPAPGSTRCGSSGSEAEFASRAFTVPPAAFEFYIQGLLDTNEASRLRNLREAARLQPLWDAPAFALGDTYFTRRNCDASLPWLTRVPLARPSGLLASFEAGVCHLLRGDSARARTALSAVLDRAPSPLPEAQSNLGIALAREGAIAGAQAAFDRATRIDADEPDYWLHLGLLHLRAKRPEAAIAPLRRVLTLQPADAQARALLALALEQTGRVEEAAAERETLSRSSVRVVLPRNPEAADFNRFDRIRMRLDPGSLRPPALSDTAATENGSEAMRARERLALHLDRGRQFLESGDLDDAHRAFIEALLLSPLDANAHLGLAQVYDRQGRPNDGVREYRAALASQDDTATRLALAQLLFRNERRAEARIELDQVLRREPSNAEALELREQLTNGSSGGPP